MEKIRISKYFTDCGIMSRRAAEKEIEQGKVKVNGSTAVLGQQIDPEHDTVEYNGKTVRIPTSEKLCVMLNKPRGIVTTASDEKGRTNVTALCSSVRDNNGSPVRLYPIGRLDMDSDGLILLTNDGDLANKLTHPRHSIPKIYHVTVSGHLTDEQLSALGDPIVIDGRATAKVKISTVSRDSTSQVLEFELYEGRNRQIRRMCDAHGVRILRLCRVAIGDLKLGDLPTGKWRKLTDTELNYLKSI